MRLKEGHKKLLIKKRTCSQPYNKQTETHTHTHTHITLYTLKARMCVMPRSEINDTANEEALDPDERTTDTLKGRMKGGKHNQHSTFKVKLKAEEKVNEMKRPLDGDTFVTNEESPLNVAKDIAKKSFRRIRQETMMGKAGTTSEETNNE